eukprot:1054776-Pyramimonas_sp.AAC.1
MDLAVMVTSSDITKKATVSAARELSKNGSERSQFVMSPQETGAEDAVRNIAPGDESERSQCVISSEDMGASRGLRAHIAPLPAHRQ